MRFLARSFIGLLLVLATLGLAGYGGVRLTQAFRAADEAGGRKPAQERVFAVAVQTLRSGAVRPVLTAYGDIRSARTLELRAARGGEIVDLAEGFRDGAAVREGELLFRVDPAPALSDLDRARISLSEAETEMKEARGGVDLAEKEHAAAGVQRDLRAKALKRQNDLKSRGVGTEPAVETAALALSAANQVLIGREQALVNAENRVGRAEIALRRAEVALADASRALAETKARAPFAGLLSQTAAVLGRRVNPGEKLGVLIDPTALEAAFRLSNAEFARLIDPDGRLPPLPVSARLEIAGAPISVSGHLVRAAAAVAAGQTGRMVYAALDAGDAPVLRPGDFVTVEVEEPELSEVSIVPASAVTEDGRILVLGRGDRLREVQARILRRMGDEIALAGAPEGERVVTVRQPQLGPGVKVRPLRGPAVAGAPTTAALSPVDGGTVELDDARRARLIAYVEADGAMTEDERDRILASLAASAAPRALVERLEARMGGG